MSKSKSDNFKKGDDVQARWAGSNKFYEGKIVEVLKTVCKVKFEKDGSISSVKLSDIKKAGKASDEFSPKVTRAKATRSRSRSRGRPPKSTSRSRSRSPARKVKATKDKAKSVSKTAEKKEEKADKSASPNSLAKDVTDSIKKPLLTREKLGTPDISTKLNSLSSKQITSILTREESSSERSRTTKRLSALRSMEATQRQLTGNAQLSKKLKYSDAEEEDEEKEKTEQSKKTDSKVWLTFYFLCVLSKIIVAPAILLFLTFACTQKRCTLMEIPTFFTRMSVLVNNLKLPLPSIAAFHIILCLLPLIPIGKKVPGFPSIDSKASPEYRLHGFIYVICIAIAMGVSAYFGVNISWGCDKFKAVAISCFVYSFLFALFLYAYNKFKGDGPVQSKAPILGKFYVGSFVNPILFNRIDVKTSFIQAGLIGSVIINIGIVAKYFLTKGTRAIVPLGLTSGMQVFFVLDLLFRHEKLLSSATYTSDSVGYAFIVLTGFLIPIGLSYQNMYHFFYETKTSFTAYWNYAIIAAIVLLFFLGYALYMVSSNLKHNFRRDPYGKSMLKHDSIPTQVKSKRLLVSGGWGLVRHPNYLGLLLMAVAWTLPCGFTHLAPYGPLVLLAFALLFRIFKVERECQEKYGPGWKSYTDKVRSRVIPYVF